MQPSISDQHDIVALLSQEVVDLHVFLQAWLKGEAPADGPGLSRLRDALVDDFLVIHPTGGSDTRDGAVRNFAGAHGSRASDYRLVISDIQVRLAGDDIGIVNYVESHKGTGQSGRDRFATAVLKLNSETASVDWLHLHETYLPK